MIFSELYSAYYNAVADIIAAVIDGEGSEKELQSAVTKRAFGESVLTILPSLKSEKWQVMRSDLTTPIEHKPTMPPTLLQKRWLKAISLDPRIRLFGVEIQGLDDVDPLFTAEDYCVYDKYTDGDPYDDEGYISRFRLILQALHEGTWLKLHMVTGKGQIMHILCRPIKLEYSEKDDKFRLITAGDRRVTTVNLARITECELFLAGETATAEANDVKYDTITVVITDERNTLERFMLHFAHFEKRAEKIDEKHYSVKIKYAADDMAEMVIRMLSFGALVEVLGSDRFKEAFLEKLKMQFGCGL